MASRERKRAERQKRKARSGSSIERGYAKAEQRNREVREALEPLHEDERPLVVTIGAVISALIVISILIGYASGVKVNGSRPALVQALSPAFLMGVMSWGMWRARYWAVLGFQTILLFLIFAAAFGLALGAASAAQIFADLALLAIAGTFFYFMIKAMARIQMPHRLPRD
ncbi:MAG: hypothetical protein AABM43_05365 [Actinomycetota bacterium]